MSAKEKPTKSLFRASTVLRIGQRWSFHPANGEVRHYTLENFHGTPEMGLARIVYLRREGGGGLAQVTEHWLQRPEHDRLSIGYWQLEAEAQ